MSASVTERKTMYSSRKIATKTISKTIFTGPYPISWQVPCAQARTASFSARRPFRNMLPAGSSRHADGPIAGIF
jgi:hypothetical protein